MVSSANRSQNRSLRAHRKSRLGCRPCKQRKVKCDENRPVCGNCSQRFGSRAPCDYASPLVPTFVSVKDPNPITPALNSTSRSSFPLLESFLALPLRDNMRCLELRLFHHYTAVMSSTMACFGRAELAQLWISDVPQLSFTSDAALSSTLGFAATHILSLNPENSSMKQAAQYYIVKAISQLSTLVTNLDVTTAEPAILVALFIIIQTRRRAAFRQEDEHYVLPLSYFHMHYGAVNLYSMSRQYIPGSKLLTFIDIEPTPFKTDPLCKHALPTRVWQDSLSLLDGLNCDSNDPNNRRVYEGALSYLNTIYISLLRGEDPQWTQRRLLSMPGNVPRAFFTLLEQQDSRSMAILARFSALMKSCDGSRYFQGTAEYEVRGIAGLMPPDWLWAMEWPYQILKLDKFADCVPDVFECGF